MLWGLAAVGLLQAAGLSRHFLTKIWSSADGLPDSSVTSIAQTPDGYLWVGTYNGLARFDGLNFRIFDPDNTPGLAHARMRRLSLDRRGVLWVNTFDGSLTSVRDGVMAREWTSLVRNDRDDRMFASGSHQIGFVLGNGQYHLKSLDAPPGSGWTRVALPNQNIHSKPLGDGGSIAWFNGPSKRMWNLVAGEFRLLREAERVPGQRIRCVEVDSQGTLWVGSDRGIASIVATNVFDVTPTNGEAVLDVRQMCLSEDGGLWVFANGRVRKARGGAWIAEGKSLRGVFTPDNSRMGLVADGNGGVWIWEYNRGLAHVGPDGGVWRFAGELGFNPERVTSVFIDHENNVWAGFEPGGLVRIRESRFRLPPRGDLPMGPARSVAEDADEVMWLADMGGGLRRWKGDEIESIRLPADSPGTLVSSVFPDAKGRLWMSAGVEDLCCLVDGSIRWVQPRVHAVKALLADRAGRVWAGTRSGLYVWDGKEPMEFKLVEGGGQGGIRALAEDSRGNVWCGGGDGVLYQINDAGVEAFLPPGAAQPHAIWSLLAEPDGVVWVGTFRGGLLRFKDRTFTRFSKAQELPNDVICQILADDRAHLWLGTQGGIVRVAKADLENIAEGRAQLISGMILGPADGLPSSECLGGYQPAAWKTRDGWLWFTTLKGAAGINPESIEPNPVAPPTHIEQVLVDGVVWWPIDGGAGPSTVVSRPVGDGRRLVVPPGRRQLEFHYAGLSFVSPERVQYRYRLEGEDDDWVRAGTRRFAHYSSLRAGAYRFHVMARNSDGLWDEMGSSLAVRIEPFFHETIWFRTTLLLAILGLVTGVVRYRLVVKFRRQAELLERRHALERERARIAKDIHDDLGSSLTLIAVMGDLAGQNKDNRRIEKISATARQAVKSLDEIVWAVNPRNDQLSQLLDYIGGYAVEYLSAAEIRCRLEIPDHLPTRELSSKIRYNVFLAAKEALQNVVKHAAAAEVRLRATVLPEGLKLVIEDNGRGFGVAPQNDLADGLRNMSHRMQDIGGNCTVESEAGVGTRVTLEFPFAPLS